MNSVAKVKSNTNKIFLLIFTTCANICTKPAIVGNTEAPAAAMRYGAATYGVKAIGVKRPQHYYPLNGRNTKSLY